HRPRVAAGKTRIARRCRQALPGCNARGHRALRARATRSESRGECRCGGQQGRKRLLSQASDRLRLPRHGACSRRPSFPPGLPLGRDSQISADTTRVARLSATASNYNVALSTRTDRGRSAAERKKWPRAATKPSQRRLQRSRARPRPKATTRQSPLLRCRPSRLLSPEMAAYFEKCEEKLGFVPNVLKAY